MQQELDEEAPGLGIRIIGINKIGAETGIESFDAAQHVLPMVNDPAIVTGTDEEGNEVQAGLIWQEWGQACQELEHEDWNKHWRDVFILDAENNVIRVYNLTLNSLSDETNYNELKSILLEEAGHGQE